MPKAALIKNTRSSLESVQDFNTEQLARTEDLGREMSLAVIVGPASQIVNLHKKLSISALEDFPDEVLTKIQNHAEDIISLFNKALEFKVADGGSSRDDIINQINGLYQETFDLLHPYISYSMHKSTDFESLETTTRQFLDNVTAETKILTNEIAGVKQDADAMLDQVRSIAAEHGVTQQAVYFRDEAENNKKDAKIWFKYSCWISVALSLYAIATFFIHKWTWIMPSTIYETIQLAISKVLVFGVLSYALYFCSKNYFSHKHNYVVNKHRQNALVTYESIVKAAGDKSNSDIILGLASSCIFAPQATGYSGSKQGTNSSNPATMFMNPLVQAATSGENTA